MAHLKVIMVVTTAVLSVACATDFHLLILHNNDMHARFEETSQTSGTCTVPPCYGGFARVAHVVREARNNSATARGPPVLFLNAGDTYTGTVWFSRYRHQITTEFVNLLRPDAMSLGNHEFDDKVSGLLPFINKLTSPTVCVNINASKEPELEASAMKPSVVIEIDNFKIAIIGYLTPETAFLSSPGNVIFKDEVDTIKKESERLWKLGVRIFIALGHSGFEMDKKIAAEVPLIDLVIGGHTNTFLYTGNQPDIEVPSGPYPTIVTSKAGKHVPVVQAYAYTKYLGQLNLTFDKNGDLKSYRGNPILLDSKIPQAKDVLEVLEKYRPGVDELKKSVIGNTKVLLQGDIKCRSVECNLGNLIADATVNYRSVQYGGKFWTDAPIAFIQGGGIRTSIDASSIKGNITKDLLMGVMPFENFIYSMKLMGGDLLTALEFSVRKYETEKVGGFLQFSGLQVTYNISQPVGNRVVSALARCANCSVPTYEPIDSKKVYKVLMPSFLAFGGDGYEVFMKNGFDVINEEVLDVELVSDFLSKKSPVYPEVSGRINFVAEQHDKPSPNNTHKNSGTLPAAVTFIYIFSVAIHYVL